MAGKTKFLLETIGRADNLSLPDETLRDLQNRIAKMGTLDKKLSLKDEASIPHGLSTKKAFIADQENDSSKLGKVVNSVEVEVDKVVDSINDLAQKIESGLENIAQAASTFTLDSIVFNLGLKADGQAGVVFANFSVEGSAGITLTFNRKKSPASE